jgi:primosomal protein N'
MFVIQVTPLIKGTRLESLSYFSSIKYEIGSFLQVPIRGKNQSAIVTETKPVSSTKTALKAASFSLRKLPEQKNPPLLPKAVQATAEALSDVYPSSAGSLLFTLLPPDIRNGSRPFPQTGTKEHSEESTPHILTAKLEDRFLQYQSHIRGIFAQKGSVLFVVPSAAEVNFAQTSLSLGIKDRVVVLSPSQTKRQRDVAYAKIESEAQALLIITTPTFAYLDRADVSSIIIEQSASGHYVGRQRPYLDHRTALTTYAKVSKRSILLGDTIPRTEDEVARRDDTYFTYGDEAKRIAFTAPLSIITQKDKPRSEAPFQLFSQELKVSVERALEGRGHVFFYSARRGLAPVIACIDCGYIFRCPDSNTPYSLVRTMKNGEEERWFVSSTSGRREKAADVCLHCGSWRLRERGIGIQQVADEWQQIMPDCDITVLDNLTATTQKQAQKIVTEFFQKRNGLLIGTQIALPYLSLGVDVSAVISLDATRSIPTWRADEYLFRLLMRLRECTKKEVIVQTRTESDNLLLHATRGAVERFYDDEIALRSMMQYPPYSTFILLSWIGNISSVTELGKPVEALLDAFVVQYYNNPNSSKEKTLRHGLIRVPVNKPDERKELIALLRRVPPYVKVEINPERIV